MTRRQGWEAMMNKATTKKTTTPKNIEDLEVKDAAKVTGGQKSVSLLHLSQVAVGDINYQ